MKKIIIAGTGSNVGKTTITIAIMRALTAKGYKIAPFKTGPDYIDPKFHKVACNTTSINLDSFLIPENTLKYLFVKNSKGKDISIIEGVMGLYDGSDLEGNDSSAYISKLLSSPVLLIVDGSAAYLSICATILGFKNFDPDVNIAGVIINNISGGDHYNNLKKAIKDKTGIICTGYFPKVSDIEFDSRHLGLIPTEEISNIEETINKLGEIALKTIDLNLLQNIINENHKIVNYEPIKLPEFNNNNLKIGIALDKAFNFYYQDNLDLLESTGIELVYFSLINDKKLPDNINGLYIGGGFPEIFCDELSENSSMLKDILFKLENGLPCYAECGGLMYLTESIENHKTVGFFNTKSVMTKKLQRFGYVEFEYENIKTKAHEFHYSDLVIEKEKNFSFSYKVTKPGTDRNWVCGLKRMNVLAGYPHVHFYSNPLFLAEIIKLWSNR